MITIVIFVVILVTIVVVCAATLFLLTASATALSTAEIGRPIVRSGLSAVDSEL